MAVDGDRVESARMVSRPYAPPDMWAELLAAFDRPCPVFEEAGRQFNRFSGLVDILNGRCKRPRSGPAKLCIDGREYHRRQRNRAKRRR